MFRLRLIKKVRKKFLLETIHQLSSFKMKFWVFVARAFMYAATMLTGYEVAELFNVPALQKYDEKFDDLHDNFMDALKDNKATEAELADIKTFGLVIAAFMVFIMAALVIGMLCGIFYSCKRCFTKTVRKSIV